MKYVDCVNYINPDCEKGMCALSKQIVPIDVKHMGPEAHKAGTGETLQALQTLYLDAGIACYVGNHTSF